MADRTGDTHDILTDSHLTYWILLELHSRQEPLGAGSVTYILQRRGSSLSAPTIGRKLRDLEQRGLVRKVGVGGRVLTPAGHKLLKRLEQEYRLDTSTQKFLKQLKEKSRKDIVDQLVSRRTIEGETASLAASRISEEGMNRLDSLIRRQREQVNAGETGIEEDLEFHSAIAEASGNGVLAAMVKLLRSDGWLNHVMVAIRARVGTRFVVDHEEIVRAIRSRDPLQAREAMEHHIDRLIADVDRCWEQVLSDV